VHLIAPNPIYRRLHSRLQKRDNGSESVLLRFEPRVGKSVCGLKLHFQEGDRAGATDVRQVTIQDEMVRINIGREVEGVAFLVPVSLRPYSY
jgi:hypothetical protein